MGQLVPMTATVQPPGKCSACFNRKTLWLLRNLDKVRRVVLLLSTTPVDDQHISVFVSLTNRVRVGIRELLYSSYPCRSSTVRSCMN